MAGLLKEQQTKLSALAEQRRQLQAELAATRGRAAEEVRAAEEAARQSAERAQAEHAAAQAAVTREQLAVAQAREAVEKAHRQFDEEKAALAKEHDAALRVKDKVLDDVSAQLSQARGAAKASELSLAQAKRERDEVVGEAHGSREAREQLNAAEETIARLEGALEELESARAEASADADAAREELRRKEQMLEFVEGEVHSVKALFNDKEAAMAQEAERRLDAKEREMQRAQEALNASTEALRQAQAERDVAEEARAEAYEVAERERSERERMAERLDALGAEAERALADKAKVEGEMRLVLKAMDAQKAAAARNMMQLNKIAQDWNSQINSPV